MIRPSFMLLLVVVMALLFAAGLAIHGKIRRAAYRATDPVRLATVAALGLTDLCVATEARYTRHPAVSDPIAPFMDHPGALEHFPTGSFWTPQAAGSAGRAGLLLATNPNASPSAPP